MQSVESSNRRSVILRNWVPVKCSDGSLDWSESFSHALEAYRSAACDGLDASLAVLALPPSRPSSALETL
jgi:hypothetical protein